EPGGGQLLVHRVDDRLEQHGVAGDQPDARPDEDRVVALGGDGPADRLDRGPPQVDLAPVDVEARPPELGDVAVVGGLQLVRGQATEPGEPGRAVVHDVGVEPDLNGGDGHGVCPPDACPGR